MSREMLTHGTRSSDASTSPGVADGAATSACCLERPSLHSDGCEGHFELGSCIVPAWIVAHVDPLFCIGSAGSRSGAGGAWPIYLQSWGKLRLIVNSRAFDIRNGYKRPCAPRAIESSAAQLTCAIPTYLPANRKVIDVAGTTF